MILHISKNRSTTETEPLVTPSLPTGGAENRMRDVHGWERARACLVKPFHHEHEQTDEGEATDEASRHRRAEFLSLAFSALAVTLLLQMALVTWALNAYVWPMGILGEVIVDFQDGYVAYGMFLKPGYVIGGFLMATVLLIAKEYLMAQKWITLSLNVMASIFAIGYATFYCVLSVLFLYATSLVAIARYATG